MDIKYEEVDKYRVKRGPMKTMDRTPYGVFGIPYQSFTLTVIATDGKGVEPEWEHISVSLKNRCPNWKEMCFIKDLFWGEDEIAIQYHPKKEDYVNNHNNCLHIWRPVGVDIPTPPSILVGMKGNNDE